MRFIKLDVPFVFAKGGCGSGTPERVRVVSLTRAPITSISISHVPGVQ